PPDRSPRSRRPLTRPPEPRPRTARVWLWSRCGPSGDHNHTFERPLLSWRGPPAGTAMLIRGTHPLTPSREAEKEASAGEFWRPTHGRPQWRRHPPGSDPDHTRDPRTEQGRRRRAAARHPHTRRTAGHAAGGAPPGRRVP